MAELTTFLAFPLANVPFPGLNQLGDPEPQMTFEDLSGFSMVFPHVFLEISGESGGFPPWFSPRFTTGKSMENPPRTSQELQPFLLSFRTEEARKESVLRFLDLLGVAGTAKVCQNEGEKWGEER
jgi:hypothetical protein